MSAKADFISLNQCALDEASELIGECFTYKGTSYTGVINEVEFEDVLMSGGLFQKLGAIIIVSRTRLTTKPNVGETIKIDGLEMRIERVKSDETSFELICITASA